MKKRRWYKFLDVVEPLAWIIAPLLWVLERITGRTMWGEPLKQAEQRRYRLTR